MRTLEQSRKDEEIAGTSGCLDYKNGSSGGRPNSESFAVVETPVGSPT